MHIGSTVAKEDLPTWFLADPWHRMTALTNFLWDPIRPSLSFRLRKSLANWICLSRSSEYLVSLRHWLHLQATHQATPLLAASSRISSSAAKLSLLRIMYVEFSHHLTLFYSSTSRTSTSSPHIQSFCRLVKAMVWKLNFWLFSKTRGLPSNYVK